MRGCKRDTSFCRDSLDKSPTSINYAFRPSTLYLVKEKIDSITIRENRISFYFQKMPFVIFNFKRFRRNYQSRENINKSYFKMNSCGNLIRGLVSKISKVVS